MKSKMLLRKLIPVMLMPVLIYATGASAQVGEVAHCTSVVASSGTITLLPSAAYKKIQLATVLYDSDVAADIVNSQIVVPSWAANVQVTGHIQFPVQNLKNAWAGGHLFRNNSPTSEGFYHSRTYYPMSTDSLGYVSLVMVSPVIPVQSVNETWQLFGWQDSGGTQYVGGQGNWLQVCFYQ